MRISTQMIHDGGLNAIQRQQSELFKLQQQIGSGRRILTPSDDPVASSRAVVVSQAQATAQQHARNTGAAKDYLSAIESAVAELGAIVVGAKTLAIAGGNPTQSDADRATLAQDLRGKFQQLMAQANTQDGSGSYLFSGYAETTQPFSGSLGAVVYNGDAGEREVQVSDSRKMPVTLNGASLFQSIKNGNGVFATSAVASNTGAGVISGGRVLNPPAWNGDDYEIRFSSAATYDVVNTTTATTVSSANAYASGGAIAFSGVQVEITGAPQAGDVFTLQPSTNQSVFETFNNLIKTLESPVTGAPAQAQLRNGLNRALGDLDRVLDQTLSARTLVGARQSELDSISFSNEDYVLRRSVELGELINLDYAKATSDLSRQLITLEAAQRSYVKITSLSLFDLI